MKNALARDLVFALILNAYRRGRVDCDVRPATHSTRAQVVLTFGKENEEKQAIRNN